jgi:hypothetical protein
MEKVRRRVWWAPESVGTRRCDSAHIDMRSGASPDGAVGRRSRVARKEERSSIGPWGLLLKHLALEKVALDRHSHQCDEEHVKLRQGLAVAE